MAPKCPAYDVDWIWSNISNVHVAQHRDWFSSFTPFKSITEEGDVVLGIGDVELNVKTQPGRTGKASHGKMILRNVLYIPRFEINIFAAPNEEGLVVSTEQTPGKVFLPGSGRVVARLDYVPQGSKLWLVDHAKGQTSIQKGASYVLRVTWPDEERAAWEAYQSSDVSTRIDPSSREPVLLISVYTGEERAWLDDRWGNEFAFLKAQGLKYENTDDREKGRLIVRAVRKVEGDAMAAHEKNRQEAIANCVAVLEEEQRRKKEEKEEREQKEKEKKQQDEN